MTLQERIKKNEVYFRGMEIVNNTAIIKVLYGEKWGAYPSPDEKIKVANHRIDDLEQIIKKES